MNLFVIFQILLSYSIGSISGSMVLGKIKGVDIRKMGSGNAGGTNAFRTQGALFGIIVIIIDILKGYIATYYISGDFGRGEMIGILCGISAILGHVYPIYFNFKGGKGAGTMVGILVSLFPLGLLYTFSVWIFVLILTGYVGLSTILAGISYPIIIFYFYPNGINSIMGIFSILISLFLLFTHRSNIFRMIKGNENRFEKIMIFKRIIN